METGRLRNKIFVGMVLVFSGIGILAIKNYRKNNSSPVNLSTTIAESIQKVAQKVTESDHENIATETIVSPKTEDQTVSIVTKTEENIEKKSEETPTESKAEDNTDEDDFAFFRTMENIKSQEKEKEESNSAENNTTLKDTIEDQTETQQETLLSEQTSSDTILENKSDLDDKVISSEEIPVVNNNMWNKLLNLIKSHRKMIFLAFLMFFLYLLSQSEVLTL